jgi:hypothetical protein
MQSPVRHARVKSAGIVLDNGACMIYASGGGKKSVCRLLTYPADATSYDATIALSKYACPDSGQVVLPVATMNETSFSHLHILITFLHFHVRGAPTQPPLSVPWHHRLADPDDAGVKFPVQMSVAHLSRGTSVTPSSVRADAP